MSAYILLNLLKDLGKEIKCEACQEFYRIYATSFNKFNTPRAQMLDSIHHMTLKLL